VLSPAALARESDILLLTVPDDVLPGLAEELAAHVRPGQLVLHTSGRLGAGVLAPLASAGARTVACHPAMTFAGVEADVERRCVFGLTAADTEREAAEALVADLGGTPMWIAEADRVAYHAALAHGANHLVTLVAQAMDALRSVGAQDPAAVLRPLLSAALDNTLAYGDAALTGPIARGDAEAVRDHLDALDETTAQTYRALAQATAARALDSGRLRPEQSEPLRETLARADRAEEAVR